MQMENMKRVVIITEASIKNDIIEHIVSEVVKSYTIDTVGGKGERGIREEDSSILGDFLKKYKD